MIDANETQSWLKQHSEQTFNGQDIAWLNTQRSAALTHFETIGLPGVRDEKWRYTNLRALKSKAYSSSVAGAGSSVSLPQSNNVRLVFVDGHFDDSLSSHHQQDGVVFTNTVSQLANLEHHYGACLPTEQHGFTALNTAFAQDGYVLKITKDTAVNTVLEVIFISSSNDTVSHTRNVIIAEANTQCTLIERHIGSDGTVYLNNTITEISAGDNAHIDHYKIQQESDDAFHVGGVFIKQRANSHVKNHNIALSGLVTRNDTNTDLLGQGAHMEMNGLVLGKGRQHIDNHTEVNHAVANCTSDEYYKTVLDDNSRSVFRGRIIVAEDAQQTNADQQNNNLLLSNNAEADTKPQLEIYADDVLCSHGATVGQLDPASLFYLKSRGINTEQARGLLTFAFANQVIDRIKVESIQKELTNIIAGELLAGLEELV